MTCTYTSWLLLSERGLAQPVSPRSISRPLTEASGMAGESTVELLRGTNLLDFMSCGCISYSAPSSPGAIRSLHTPYVPEVKTARLGRWIQVLKDGYLVVYSGIHTTRYGLDKNAYFE